MPQIRCTYPDCNYILAGDFDLHQHEREKHTGERPYRCTFCEEQGVESGFARSWALSRHVRTVHNIDIHPGKGRRGRRASMTPKLGAMDAQAQAQGQMPLPLYPVDGVRLQQMAQAGVDRLQNLEFQRAVDSKSPSGLKTESYDFAGYTPGTTPGYTSGYTPGPTSAYTPTLTPGYASSPYPQPCSNNINNTAILNTVAFTPELAPGFIHCLMRCHHCPGLVFDTTEGILEHLHDHHGLSLSKHCMCMFCTVFFGAQGPSLDGPNRDAFSGSSNDMPNEDFAAQAPSFNDPSSNTFNASSMPNNDFAAQEGMYQTDFDFFASDNNTGTNQSTGINQNDAMIDPELRGSNNTAPGTQEAGNDQQTVTNATERASPIVHTSDETTNPLRTLLEPIGQFNAPNFRGTANTPQWDNTYRTTPNTRTALAAYEGAGTSFEEPGPMPNVLPSTMAPLTAQGNDDYKFGFLSDFMDGSTQESQQNGSSDPQQDASLNTMDGETGVSFSGTDENTQLDTFFLDEYNDWINDTNDGNSFGVL